MTYTILDVDLYFLNLGRLSHIHFQVSQSHLPYHPVEYPHSARIAPVFVVGQQKLQEIGQRLDFGNEHSPASGGQVDDVLAFLLEHPLLQHAYHVLPALQLIVALQKLRVIIECPTHQLVPVLSCHSAEDEGLPYLALRSHPQEHRVFLLQPEPAEGRVAALRVTLQPILVHGLGVLVHHQPPEHPMDLLVHYDERVPLLHRLHYGSAGALADFLPLGVRDPETAIPSRHPVFRQYLVERVLLPIAQHHRVLVDLRIGP